MALEHTGADGWLTKESSLRAHIRDLLAQHEQPNDEPPAVRLERLIENLLVAGDSAEHAGFLEAAAMACAAVTDLLKITTYDSPARLLSKDYRNEARARSQLLTAIVMAKRSTHLTGDLHTAFREAIVATHQLSPNGTLECLAHRAYGATLLYYGQDVQALIELTHPHYLLNVNDEKTHYRWVTATTLMAEAAYNLGNTKEAIRLLRWAAGRLTEAFEGRLVGARSPHIAAALYLAVVLHRSGHTAEANQWLQRAAAAAEHIDPEHADPLCNEARRAKRLHVLLYSATWSSDRQLKI
jgi:hypothetical protein